MDLLTPGVLARLVQHGDRPDDFVAQVLGSKLVGEGGNKVRLALWDGQTEYKHALLDVSTSSVPIPEKFSIVKISDSDRPGTVAEHTIKQVPKAGGLLNVLVVQHYTMVKKVGSRLGGSSQSNGHSQPVFSQAATPPSHNTSQSYTTPPSSGTPFPRPPPSKVGTPSTSVGRQNVKRNLESVLDAPASKRVCESNPTHQVADLNPYINRYKLKVRVDTKSQVKKISSQRFEGSVQDCIISDQSGSIKVTAWARQDMDDTVKLDKLVVGSTYMLEGLMVKPIHNPKFNTTGHNYELTWSQNTVASGPVTDSPIQKNYNFVPISSLANTQADTVVDLLAWVREVGDLIQFRSKSEKDFKKREIVLSDNSNGGTSINLVLWAEQAEQFASGDAIIAIKGAKLAEYNGVKNISLGYSGTYEVSPPVPEAEELESWASGLRGVVGMPASQGSQGGIVAGQWSTLQEIKDMMAENRTEKKFAIVASPIKVKTDNMWYRAHIPRDGKRCQKKVTENATSPELYDCKCGDRKLSESETELRYVVNMCLADCTSWAWATMFNASNMFHMTAQELNDLRITSESKFLDLVNKVQFTEAVFHVTAKVETHNQSPQLKFNIQDMDQVGWGEEGGKEHVKRRWLDIIRLEEELGVSHEEEFGIAVSGTAAYTA